MEISPFDPNFCFVIGCARKWDAEMRSKFSYHVSSVIFVISPTFGVTSFHQRKILFIQILETFFQHLYDLFCSYSSDSLPSPHSIFKVSEYPFKENKNTLKNIQVLLYTYFYNISLNVLRPNFLNICNLPISHFPNIRKIRVNVGPKMNYFSYFMSSCTDRIVVFNNFFHLYLANLETNKMVPTIFQFSNIF